MEAKIREMLDGNRADDAIAALEAWHDGGGEMTDTLWYLLGNAWRKKGNWQMAMNNYHQAIALNPESPARHALDIANEILDFYNKDMYNQ